MIDLCTLGTGGALPLPERGLASLYVRLNGRLLLVDCGEGTQNAVRRAGWGFRAVDAILLTHYHADHCGGLPGFLLSMAKSGRTEPVQLYGPAGLEQIVGGLRVIAPVLPFETVLHPIEPGDSFEAIGMRVDAFRLQHSVPCLGYRFSLRHPGAFDPAKAEALCVPRPFWKVLQRGEPGTLGGRMVLPEEVLGPERRGLSFVYATDTRPVAAIAEAGRGTDLMILEGMYGGENKLPKALKNRHMLFREAAALAAEAGTEQLLLTHFSNCIETPEDFLPAAQAVFPETRCAQEQLTLTLEYTKN